MARKKSSGEAAVGSIQAAAKPTGGSRIQPAVTREMIAKRAYELYVARGKVDGYAEQDWRQAERELLSKRM